MRDTSHANTCQWVEIQWTHKTIFQLFAKSTVGKQKVSTALHGNKGITNWHSSIMSLLFLVILPERILFEVCLFHSPIQNYVVVFNLYPVFRILFWCHSVKVQILFFLARANSIYINFTKFKKASSSFWGLDYIYVYLIVNRLLWNFLVPCHSYDNQKTKLTKLSFQYQSYSYDIVTISKGPVWIKIRIFYKGLCFNLNLWPMN